MPETRLTILSPSKAAELFATKEELSASDDALSALADPETGHLRTQALPPVSQPTIAATRRTSVLDVLGDSNTAIFSDETTRKYGISVPHALAYMSRGRILLVHNSGVPSDTSRMILARLDAVIARRPGFVYLQAGSNDTTKTPEHFADARAAYREIVESCLAEGIEVIVGAIPPRGATRTSGLRASEQVNRYTKIWNVFLRQVATEYRLKFVDVYSAVIDPATGDWGKDKSTGAELSADKVHWTQEGVLVAAKYILEQILPLFPNVAAPLAQEQHDVLNFCQDPLFLGPLASGSGGRFPLGFNGTSDPATLAMSIVDPTAGDGLGAGRWLKAAMSGSAATQFNMIRTIASMRTSSGLDAKAGDRIAVGFPFRISNLTGTTPYVTISLSFRGAAGAVLKTVVIAAQYRLAFSGVAYVEETLPEGCVDVRLDFGKGVDTATADVHLGQVSIYDLTAMGLGSLLVGEDQGLAPVPTMTDVPATVVTSPTEPATPTPAPALGAVLTSDTFDRADTAANVLGSTDAGLGGTAGLAWSVLTQSQILSNRLAGTWSNIRYPGVDLTSLGGTTNGRVSGRIYGALGGGVFLRGPADGTAGGYLALVTSTGAVGISRIAIPEGGTVVGTQSLTTSAASVYAVGDKLSLAVSGQLLIAFVNDVEVTRYVDDAPNRIVSGPRAGFRTVANNSVQFDSFIVNAA